MNKITNLDKNEIIYISGGIQCRAIIVFGLTIIAAYLGFNEGFKPSLGTIDFPITNDAKIVNSFLKYKSMENECIKNCTSLTS